MSHFNYNPEDANPILPEGEYEAVVFDAKTGTTKTGEPKIQVMVKAYGLDNVQPLVTDQIVSPFGIRRLKQLCEATGVPFDTGEVNPAGFTGKNVRVRLRIRRDPDGQYDDQNTVGAYLSDAPSQGSTTAKTVPPANSAQAKSPLKVDEAAAYAGYVTSVRQDHLGASDEQLMKNWTATCDGPVPGKPKSEFTEADWIKVRDEGPKEFVPF